MKTETNKPKPKPETEYPKPILEPAGGEVVIK
jgi:hypothetical protein